MFAFAAVVFYPCINTKNKKIRIVSDPFAYQYPTTSKSTHSTPEKEIIRMVSTKSPCFRELRDRDQCRSGERARLKNSYC